MTHALRTLPLFLAFALTSCDSLNVQQYRVAGATSGDRGKVKRVLHSIASQLALADRTSSSHAPNTLVFYTQPDVRHFAVQLGAREVRGDIVIELDPGRAPQTVNNFVNLANQHFYDNLVWHRLSQNPPVIQTGDPNTRYGNTSRSTWGSGGSPQTIPLELDKSLHNSLGYLGMARGPALDSGSSQFYINMANNNGLDGSYTVFGKVIGPMTAANKIWITPTYGSAYPEQPLNPVYLISVTISAS